MRQWRLLRERRFAAGASNMAVDCAIFAAVSQGDQPPTLRLYGWQPFCLSLGYGQRIRDVERTRLTEHGWDLVRRPTGGKAILHGDELTYSLCLPRTHPLASDNVVESYRRISRALLRALGSLDLAVDSAAQEGAASLPGAVCFDMPSHYEITIAGRKLVGSAQMRRKGGILQHGTIPLKGDLGRICDALAFASPEEREAQRQQVRRRAVTVSEALGREIEWSQLADALQAGFMSAFDISFDERELSPSEETLAKELRQTRFANEAYIMKR